MATQVAPGAVPTRESTEHAVRIMAANLNSNVDGSTPSTEQIASAVAQLQHAVFEQQNDLHAYMTGSDSKVLAQLEETQRLGRESAAVGQDVDAVSRDFDLQNTKRVPGVAEFVKLSSSRAASAKEQAVAEATLAELKEVKQLYDLLCQVEESIWSGCSTSDLVLRSLHLPDRATENPSKVGAAIQSRVALLRSTVAEQLSNAWRTAVVVGTASSVPAISVKKSVRLQLPTISRATLPMPAASSAPPAYNLSDITTAMSKLNILSDHLQHLHSNIIRDVIDPLLSLKSGQASVSNDPTAFFVNMDLEGDRSPEAVVQSAQAVLSFVRDTITTAPLPELDSFLSSLQQDTFARILSGIVMPSMPATSDGLPEWLRLVQLCSTAESELLKGADSGLLTQFAKRDAGGQWLNAFRRARLQHARQLSFYTWSTAEIEEVQLPKDEDKVKTNVVKRTSVDSSTRTSLDSPKPLSFTPAAPDDDEAEGWGFDDDPELPSLTAPITKTAAAAEDDDASGWDFDEPFDEPPPPPPPVVTEVKRPREAKRLGKRVPAKSSTTRMSVSPSPSPPRQPTPPAPNTREVPTRQAPVSAASPAFNVYRVSAACKMVLQLPSEVLREIDLVTSLADPTFANISTGMVNVLTEELEFICATTPVAQQSRRDVSPAATLQLSNEFLYIGSKLSTLETSPMWTARTDCAKRFKAAAKLLELGCLESQLVAASSALDGARHFVEMSHDNFFHQAEEAVRSVVSRLELLGVDTKRVLDDQQHQEFFGKIVESVVTRLLNDIVALNDITQVESERISSMLGQVETLDYLFKSDHSDVSTIAAHVPHWLKLCYMKEILHANLVDITYLFESGSLVDFQPAELSKLVQALFADSSKRSALLAKIGQM